MSAARPAFAMRGALLALIVPYCGCTPAAAQESWNPFRSNSEQPRERQTRPSDAAPSPAQPSVRERPIDPTNQQPAPWTSPRGGGVEKSELAPIMAPDTSGLPLELWRGLDLKTVEELLASLELPPRSPA